MVRLLLAALGCAVLLHGQTQPGPSPPHNSQTVFSVSTTLVQIDAEVTGPHQRHITDLKAGDF